MGKLVGSSTRTVLAVALTWALFGAAASPATAQDVALTDEQIAALGTTADDLAAIEPNPAWSDLGFFGDDALRVLELGTMAVDAVPYAFGDDLDTPPVITPPGTQIEELGVVHTRVPDGWVPPAQGVNGRTAFGQNAPLAAGDDVMIVWVEYDSDFDFTSGLTLNEGITLAIAGLPVWTSSFEGDTWEGANVIPNAQVTADGQVNFVVNRYEPPQSFNPVPIPAFYYRSGNVMAVGVSSDAIGALVAEGENQNASAGTEGQTSTLLYTGDSRQVTAQEGTMPDWADRPGAVGIGANGHTAPDFFVAGIVLRLLPEFFALLLPFVLLATVIILLITAPPPVSTEEEDDGDDDDAADSGTDDADESSPAVIETDDPVTNPVSTQTDPGGGFPWMWFVVVGLLLVIASLFVQWFSTSRVRDDGEDPPEPGEFPGNGLKTLVKDPGITSAPEEDPPACDWAAVYADNVDGTFSVTNWRPVKRASTTECARYEVVVASTLREYTAPVDSEELTQVSYGFWPTFWEIVKEKKKRLWGHGASTTGNIELNFDDNQYRSFNRRNNGKWTSDPGGGGGSAPRERQTDATMTIEAKLRESLSIRIKLEPRGDGACFPGGAKRKHEFRATGTSASQGRVEWFCKHYVSGLMTLKFAWPPVGSPACHNSSVGANGEPGTTVAVGGSVKSDELRNFNYDLVQDNDPSLSKSVAEGGALQATFTEATAQEFEASAGPFKLGKFTLGVGPQHAGRSNQSFTVSKEANWETRTLDEVSITADTQIIAKSTLKQRKANNYSNSALTRAEGAVRHNFQIFAETDEDPPCDCCRPALEFVLGGGRTPGGKSYDAVLKVAGTHLYLNHPGWAASGGGVAPANTVRAWTVAETTPAPS